MQMTEEMKKARSWLNRAWRQEREIDSLLRLKDETRDRLCKITSAPDAVRVSGGKDMHRFDRLAELENAIDNAVERQLAIKAEIVDMIMRMESGRHRAILLCRYTRFLTWERIAVEMNYGYRQTLRLHAAALRDIAPRIKDVIECHIADDVK